MKPHSRTRPRSSSLLAALFASALAALVATGPHRSPDPEPEAAPLGLVSSAPSAQASSWSTDELVAFRAALGRLAEARGAIEASERQILSVVQGHRCTPSDPGGDPGSEPDPGADPGGGGDPPDPPDPGGDPGGGSDPPDPPDPGIGGVPWGSVPTWVDPPPPAPPSYSIPTLADCDWTIRDRVATSTRGLPPIRLSPGEANYLVADCCRASRAAGHPWPVIGTWDNAGEFVANAGWDVSSRRTIAIRRSDGSWDPTDVTIVGLDDVCEVKPGFGDRWGRADRVTLINVGIRGGPSNWIFEGGGIETLILDGCWWLRGRQENGAYMTYHSGLSPDRYDQLVVRRHRYRGETPTSEPTKLRELSLYLRSCTGLGTWILESDLRGGNSCGFQERPGVGENPGGTRPSGAFVCWGNVLDGYGWDHGNTAETARGGSGFTLWSSPDAPVYVWANSARDVRYGCLYIGGQDTRLNWLNGSGHVFGDVFVWGNDFSVAHDGVPANVGQRPAMMYASIARLHLGPNTLGNGPNDVVHIDNEFGMTRNGIRIGDVTVHGWQISGVPFYTWDDATRRMRRMSEAEVLSR